MEGYFSIVISTIKGKEKIYLPPWETAQYNLDEVVFELVRYQKSKVHSMKVDENGNFYYTWRSNRNIVRKESVAGISSIKDLLQQLMENGHYEIPDNYWPFHWKILRDL